MGSTNSLGDKTVIFGDDNREDTARNLRETRAFREKRYLENLRADEMEQRVTSISRVIHPAVKFCLLSLIIKLGDKVSVIWI